MKMYSVVKTTLCNDDGSVTTQVLGISSDKQTANEIMLEEYNAELKNRNLEDNGASDENGDSIPGGYIVTSEAGIYDYADFAFSQLLEIVSFVVSEVEIHEPVIIPPKGEIGSLVPNGKVYIVDYQEAANSKGRFYRLSKKEVLEGTVLSVKNTSDGDFYAEVLVERTLPKGHIRKRTSIKEYKYGESVFLNRNDAYKMLETEGKKV